MVYIHQTPRQARGDRFNELATVITLNTGIRAIRQYSNTAIQQYSNTAIQQYSHYTPTLALAQYDHYSQHCHYVPILSLWQYCHSRAGRNLLLVALAGNAISEWIAACAGITSKS
jgi:hypothetical protein